MDSNTETEIGILKFIIGKLIFLTPFGYLLASARFLEPKDINGIYIAIPKDDPFKVAIETNPIFTDRLNWIINGIFLLISSFYISINYIGENFGAIYSGLGMIFGVVNFISSINPTFPWNQNTIIKLKPIDILVISSIILSVFLSGLKKYHLL